MKVAPSILTADFLHLEKDVKMIDSCADYLHLDIMDGTLVPNISFGFPVVEAVSNAVSIPLDAHLMVVNPQKWFKRLSELGVEMISFHLETTGWKTSSAIRAAKKLGMKVGLAINPDVPVEKLFKYIGKVDFFLVMSVFAGFGGQKFIYETIDRVSALRAEIVRKGASTLIEVDGGVDQTNVGTLAKAGVDIVVAGSSVLGSQDPIATVRALQAA
ncbi:MAG: ribulose-phosphate 3-epimerase [Candidatus Cryptobacteroides sp.]